VAAGPKIVCGSACLQDKAAFKIELASGLNQLPTGFGSGALELRAQFRL
jgi:hypothetical protein